MYSVSYCEMTISISLRRSSLPPEMMVASLGEAMMSGSSPMCSVSRLYSFLLRLTCFFWCCFMPMEISSSMPFKS